MTASLEERLLPILVMLTASMISAIIPLYALRRRRLNFKRDSIFIFFWFQTWIYLHLIPTLNVMFPESTFAFPPQFEEIRAIRFTAENVDLYAILAVLVLILFYFPLRYVYLRLTNRATDPAPAAPGFFCISPFRLVLLGGMYSLFSLFCLHIAWQTGFFSSYAGVMNAEMMLTGQVSSGQYYFYRLYLLSVFFLTIVVTLAAVEYTRGQRRNGAWLIWLVIAPGVACLAAWIISRSRSLLVMVLALLAVVLIRRDHLRIRRRILFRGVMIIVMAVYLFSVIVKLRGVILEPEVTTEQVLATFNPFSNRQFSDFSFISDCGMRLDGLELMVLATPRMLERGLHLGQEYLFSMISPLVNFIPGLKNKLLVERGIIDFKVLFMTEYTDITLPDYLSVALTDLYAVLGPFAFVLAAVVYAWLLNLVGRLLAPGRRGISVVAAVFILSQVFFFETASAALLFGWTRLLPALMAVLLLNPFLQSGYAREGHPKIGKPSVNFNG